MSDIDTNKAVIARFISAMSGGRIEEMLALYADDAVLTTTGTTLISGQFTKAQISAAAARIYDVFPQGIRFDVLATTAEDDRVAIEAVSHGDHVSGRHYSNRYHFLFRLRDGRIIEMKEYMDTELVTEILCAGQRPTAGAAN